MENEAYKVRHFLEGVAACGAAVALRTIQPQQDMITQRKAFAFFAKEDAKYGGNHGEAWVLEQVRLGNLHPKRKGKAVNSPLYYSKAELMQAKVAEDAVAQNIFKDTDL